MPKLNRAERRMPIRTVNVGFDDAGYTGFTAKARINPPISVALAFQSEDVNQVLATIRICYPEWDFVDEQGEPIPHDEAGTAMIPPDLLRAMILRWASELEKAVSIPKASAASSPLTTPVAPEASSEASPEDTPA